MANQTGPEITESSLGRLLVEFMMMPTALVPSDRLHWEYIDSNHSRVVLKHNNFKVEAVFKFDESGLPTKSTINRFGTFLGKIKKESFECDFLDYKFHQDLLIPTDIRGAWDLAAGPFYWFHFKFSRFILIRSYIFRAHLAPSAMSLPAYPYFLKAQIAR